MGNFSTISYPILGLSVNFWKFYSSQVSFLYLHQLISPWQCGNYTTKVEVNTEEKRVSLLVTNIAL